MNRFILSRTDLTDDEIVREEFKKTLNLFIASYDFFFCRSLILNRTLSRGNFVLTKDACVLRYENHAGLSKIVKDLPNLDKHKDLQNTIKLNNETKQAVEDLDLEEEKVYLDYHFNDDFYDPDENIN